MWEDHTLVQAFWIYSNHDTHCEQLHDWMDARIIVRTRTNKQEEQQQQQQDEHITSVFSVIIANFHIIIVIITTKVHIGHQSERSHVWHVGTGGNGGSALQLARWHTVGEAGSRPVHVVAHQTRVWLLSTDTYGWLEKLVASVSLHHIQGAHVLHTPHSTVGDDW